MNRLLLCNPPTIYLTKIFIGDDNMRLSASLARRFISGVTLWVLPAALSRSFSRAPVQWQLVRVRRPADRGFWKQRHKRRQLVHTPRALHVACSVATESILFHCKPRPGLSCKTC